MSKLLEVISKYRSDDPCLNTLPLQDFVVKLKTLSAYVNFLFNSEFLKYWGYTPKVKYCPKWYSNKKELQHSCQFEVAWSHKKWIQVEIACQVEWTPWVQTFLCFIYTSTHKRILYIYTYDIIMCPQTIILCPSSFFVVCPLWTYAFYMKMCLWYH